MQSAKRALSDENLAVEGDFGQFTDFMRQLVAVPHEKIKAEIKAGKSERKAVKRSASHVPASS